MKKTYIKPETEAAQIETVKPVAGSITFGDGTTNEMYSPELRDIWFEE